jgi:DNA gyrase/topoisomerase IV subunit A
MSRVASRTFLVVLTAFVAILSTSVLMAQNQNQGQRGRGTFGGGFGFGGFGGRETPGGDWLSLLENEKVQKEIDLLEEQKRDVEKLRAESRERMGNVFREFGNLREASEAEREKAMKEMGEKREAATKETVKQLEGILLPPQVARLKEISLQSRGTRALSDPQVQKDLGLNADQQSQITKISEEGDQKRRTLFTGGGGGNRDEIGAKMEAIRTESNEKTLAVLNADQRGKLEKMKGKPVSFDIAELQQRGRGGPGGGPGGPGRPGGDGQRRRNNDN